MKNYFRLNLFSISVAVFIPFLSGNIYRTTGEVERLDPAINEFIPQNAKIEILAEDGRSEGRMDSRKFPAFSDVPQ